MNHSKLLHIGFDAKRIVRNKTGLGNYSRTLVKNLLHAQDLDLDIRLYAPNAGNEELRNQIPAQPCVRYVYPTGKKHPLAQAWWRFTGIVDDLKRDHIDLYHGLSNELPRGIKASGVKGIVTIHDLIFLRFPKYYHWWDVLIYRYKFRMTCREATHIIAISECTKRDIVKYGHVSPDKITVIYQDCDEVFKRPCTERQLQKVREKYHLPTRFILNVGSIEERKNVLLAVKALKDMPTDIHLVVVGKSTPYRDKVKNYITQHHLQSRITLLHHVPFADLPAIYQLAECFVYPSRYEGFGIPIIEAIHSGLPVVACTGSCLEEAGGADCLYVHPDDVQAMREALLTLLNDTDRKGRIARAKAYVQRFDTENVTRQLINLYKKCME